MIALTVVVSHVLTSIRPQESNFSPRSSYERVAVAQGYPTPCTTHPVPRASQDHDPMLPWTSHAARLASPLALVGTGLLTLTACAPPAGSDTDQRLRPHYQAPGGFETDPWGGSFASIAAAHGALKRALILWVRHPPDSDLIVLYKAAGSVAREVSYIFCARFQGHEPPEDIRSWYALCGVRILTQHPHVDLLTAAARAVDPLLERYGRAPFQVGLRLHDNPDPQAPLTQMRRYYWCGKRIDYPSFPPCEPEVNFYYNEETSKSVLLVVRREVYDYAVTPADKHDLLNDLILEQELAGQSPPEDLALEIGDERS
jgi:hypothetical protein